MNLFRKKSTNYGKIIAITLAAVAGVCAVAFVVYKLIKKYTDDLLDECEDCDIAIEDAEEEECCCADAE